MRDRVTISLYSIEIEEKPGYKQGFLNEFSNIEKIRNGLVKAAIEAKREPPEFIVSVLLVPDWGRANNSYKDEQYKVKQSKFMEECKTQFEKINGFKVEDFYLDCIMAPYSREYMHQLKAMGSNADMIKTYAIINNCDRCRHLQIDSNTIVPSFIELYNKTFSAELQKDGINASYYDDDYVSAHNKMVYTTPSGDIAKKSNLQINLWEWCRDFCDDNNETGDKQAQKNSIYSKVFTWSLCEIGYVKEYCLPDRGRKIYAATLNPNVYWLTECMSTALNMSWSADRVDTFVDLKKIQPVRIGEDGLFNFQSFFNIIKKYTGDLSLHSQALELNDSSDKGDISRELLFRISNNDIELQATRNFVINAMEKAPQQAKSLLRLFRNTEHGNKLTEKLFGCSVKELPNKIEQLIISNIKEEKKITIPKFSL